MSTPIATSAQYGGSTAAVFFGLTANEVAAYGGLLIGLLGFLYNVYDKHRHFKLAQQAQSARRMKQESERE